MTFLRSGDGSKSLGNSTTTPLAASGTFTGTAELNTRQAVLSVCRASHDGTLYMELSQDGSNWDTSIPIEIVPGVNETHRIVKGPRYFRARFVNSDAEQTYFRLSCYYGEFSALNSPLNSTILEDADAEIVRVVDSEIDMAAGRFQGFSIVNKFGTNSDIDTASVPEDIWEGGGVYTGFPSELELVEVVSSSANDDSDGTGARTVRITGLDANWDVLSETVTLDGTTPVDTVAQFRRVHTATVMSAGSGGVNAGIITVRHSTTTANVFLAMAVGRNQSNVSAYTVPAGYTAYMRAMHCSIRGTAQANTPGAVEGHIWTRAFEAPFRSRRPFIVSSNYRLYDKIYGGIVFTEKSDLVLRITATSGDNASVSGGYDLILVKNIV